MYMCRGLSVQILGTSSLHAITRHPFLPLFGYLTRIARCYATTMVLSNSTVLFEALAYMVGWQALGYMFRLVAPSFPTYAALSPVEQAYCKRRRPTGHFVTL